MGYLNKENETHEAMTEDHWLKLGDLGNFFFSNFEKEIYILIKNIYNFQVSTTKMGSFQFLEKNQIL